MMHAQYASFAFSRNIAADSRRCHLHHNLDLAETVAPAHIAAVDRTVAADHTDRGADQADRHKDPEILDTDHKVHCTVPKVDRMEIGIGSHSVAQEVEQMARYIG